MTVCGRAQRNVWLCRFGSCQQPPAGRKVNEAFVVERIPKSFVYDREGKLVAQSIDRRTRSEFQQMLAASGLN